MRSSTKRYLTALLVAGAAAFSLAATDAHASSNSLDACIGVVGGCSPNGTGYILGGARSYYDYPGYSDAYQQPSSARRTQEGVYHNGY